MNRPLKENPDSGIGKFLFVESGILITAQGIRNPTNN